jgi:tRNA 2-thiouridine synthesizing protein A
MTGPVIVEEWDAGEMGCGELLVELFLRMKQLAPGDHFKLTALDPGAVEDIPSWCRMTGHPLTLAEHPVYVIRRRIKDQ